MDIVTTLFDFGEIVYLKTDADQNGRMVTGYIVRPNNNILYELSIGTTMSTHYDFEISREINVLKKMD